MKLINQLIAVMEIVGVKWRSIMSVLFHMPFLIGHVMNPLISYLTLTWYGFQMAISIPSVFLLAYYWCVDKCVLLQKRRNTFKLHEMLMLKN